MAYEKRNLGTDYVAPTGGILVVRLVARNTSEEARLAVVECTVDGEVVASGSAADNTMVGVISSPTQTFTIPVHGNSTYRVDRVGGKADVEVRWATI